VGPRAVLDTVEKRKIPSRESNPASEKANATADCSENQFIPHDLCEENHKRWVEVRFQALSEAMEDNHPGKVRPCNVQN
jgi:hypothetical protein